ncbi:hypothetical protein B0T24DRAFT_683478 [Lasiosphaeria ovina]|uniref:Uncharacterized protein n=1 Tax=Lasiosphaeria ovina TaxID=92902 RepID=A0AAE0MZ56_9PEZI|nr:hypothetical protein B0T24DRAFT_683478 [Lasiosphaeria ovina]
MGHQGAPREVADLEAVVERDRQRPRSAHYAEDAGCALAPDESLVEGDGPVYVSFNEGYGPSNKAWIDASDEHGLKVGTDPRAGKALGGFQTPVSAFRMAG